MTLRMYRRNRFCWVLVALTSATLAQGEPPGAQRSGEPRHTSLFTSGAEGYHTFRIPALIVTKKGTLLAFCEGRKATRQDFGDIDLVLKRSTDLGRSWSELVVVHEEGGSEKVTIGNPCAVVDQSTGVVWLAFCRNNNDVFVTHSDDDGKTWARPRNITSNVKKPSWHWVATGPGVGIQLAKGPHAGRLLIPGDHNPMEGEPTPAHGSHVFHSDDHGKTWRLGGELQGGAIGEPQIVELDDGSVLANVRSNVGRHRAIAVSTDAGRTWGKTRRDKALIEGEPGGCQGSILRYTSKGAGDKNRILFSNPANVERRARMTVRISYDEAKSWPIGKLLHEGPSGYSCLTVLPDMSIGLLYERGEKSFRETVSFATFSLAWLTDGQDAIDR